MTKDASRSSYTKKIIEIVGNIKKQKRDIDKVLANNKKHQTIFHQYVYSAPLIIIMIYCGIGFHLIATV